MQFITTVAAAALALGHSVQAQTVIESGSGYGTYYYDIEQVQTCGADFTSQNQGNLKCSNSALSLDTVNSNYIVAMNTTQLGADLDLYCGKRVAVTINGVKSSIPLFIGDGCERCSLGSPSSTVWDPNGSPGLDFSYSAMTELLADTCAVGYTEISWEILDDSLYTFQTTWQS